MFEDWSDDILPSQNFFTKVVKDSFNLFYKQQKRCEYIKEQTQQKFDGDWSIWIFNIDDSYFHYYRHNVYIHLTIAGYYVIIYRLYLLAYKFTSFYFLLISFFNIQILLF